MSGSKRISMAVFSILLFVFGLQLLGDSTQFVAEALKQIIKTLIQGELSALGSGWFLAYLVLNGATSAAIGIAFLESGLVTGLEAFMMISGSRLGASFIVVFIGVLEYLQGKNDDIRDSTSIGDLQFLTTYLVYIPAIAIGSLLLLHTDLSFLEVSAPAALNYGLDVLFGPFTRLLSSNLPPSILFMSSILILVASLQIFDRSFKGVGEEKFRSRYLRFHLSNRWIAFLVGATITLLTTSVALSVGIIVPMYNRGYFKRKEIIPYLMGANLTTMISSVMAAAVMDSAVGMKAVLVLTGSVFLTTMMAITFYDRSYQLIQKAFNGIMLKDRYLTVFVAILFLLPLLLIGVF